MIATIRGIPASSLGLAAHPAQDPQCVRRAFESGINYFFFYSAGEKRFVDALKPLVQRSRDEVIVASGSGSRTIRGLRAARGKTFASVGAETLDVFFAEYINPDDGTNTIFGEGGVLDELRKWKAEGWIRWVGATAHDRTLAKKLVKDSRVDILMHRYNMAHRKAAVEVFPAAVKSRTPVVAFTATRWGTLLKPHPEWPGEPPTAADCYRYCLENTAIRLVLTAPKTTAELNENLRALHSSPMDDETRDRWERFGDVVYKHAGGRTHDYESLWP